MERVLSPVAGSALRPRSSGNRVTGAPAPSVVMPGAQPGQWEICRPPGAAGADGARQIFASLEAAAQTLTAGEPFRLELPVDAGLVQRLSLPPADADELEEMARIQLEKILPYPSDAVGMFFEVVEARETEVIITVCAVYYDRLLALCQPLTSRGCWPAQVTFHALSAASGADRAGAGAIFYLEDGKVILGVCEQGKLTYAQALGTADTVASALPAMLLGAELEGINVSFLSARLDTRCAELAPMLEDLLQTPVELTPPADACGEATRGDVSPAGWREQRLRSARNARLKRQVLLGLAIYGAVLIASFLIIGVLKFQVSRLDARLAAGAPDHDFVAAAEAKWRALAPATQPNWFVAETVFQVCECLPPGDTVLLTALDLTPAAMTVQGEAPSPSAAVDFTEKFKARSELKMFRFEATPPTTLSSGRARFNVSGKILP